MAHRLCQIVPGCSSSCRYVSRQPILCHCSSPLRIFVESQQVFGFEKLLARCGYTMRATQASSSGFQPWLCPRHPPTTLIRRFHGAARRIWKPETHLFIGEYLVTDAFPPAPLSTSHGYPDGKAKLIPRLIFLGGHLLMKTISRRLS